jgi:hypothetical protein
VSTYDLAGSVPVRHTLTNWTRPGTLSTLTRSNPPTLHQDHQPNNDSAHESHIRLLRVLPDDSIESQKSLTVNHQSHECIGTLCRRHPQAWIPTKIRIQAMVEATLHQHHITMVQERLDLAMPQVHTPDPELLAVLMPHHSVVVPGH